MLEKQVKSFQKHAAPLCPPPNISPPSPGNMYNQNNLNM